MAKKRIGVLVIGQSPRPDLVGLIKEMAPDYELVQRGALDGVSEEELPDQDLAAYPLVTRMRGDKLARVNEAYLAPLLQQALERLETTDITASILLCAGTFADLKGDRPLFKPFELGCTILKVLSIKRIGVITPVAGQEIPIQARWSAMGWEPTVWVADISHQDERFYTLLDEKVLTHNLECIILDYVGHPARDVEMVQQFARVPVIDLGFLTIAALVSTL